MLEKALGHAGDYIVGSELTLADFFMLPSTYAFGLTEEGKAMYPRYPAVSQWRARMEALPAVTRFRASLPPRDPIQHARKWAVSHRPKY